MAKKAFLVLEPLRHDGEDYAVGSKISLDTKEATSLIDVGLIRSGYATVESTDESAQEAGESESPAE